MSASTDKATRREIRKAFGPEALTRLDRQDEALGFHSATINGLSQRVTVLEQAVPYDLPTDEYSCQSCRSLRRRLADTDQRIAQRERQFDERALTIERELGTVNWRVDLLMEAHTSQPTTFWGRLCWLVMGR